MQDWIDVTHSNAISGRGGGFATPLAGAALLIATLSAAQAVEAQTFDDPYRRKDPEAAKAIFADRIVLCSESDAVTTAHVSDFLARVFPKYRQPAVVDGAKAPPDPPGYSVYVYSGLAPRTRGTMTHCLRAFPAARKPVAEMIQETWRGIGRRPDFCSDPHFKRQPVCELTSETRTRSSFDRGETWRLTVNFSSLPPSAVRKSLLPQIFGLEYEFCEKEFDCGFLD